MDDEIHRCLKGSVTIMLVILHERNLDSQAGIEPASQVLRRGQDSNLLSSGHEPDEFSKSSTPLLPLLFLSLFPPSLGCLAGIEPALSKRPTAPFPRLER